ncbi:Hypp1970 [Branchiostoma lanceolatum]|uniref:Hypp1970 protein n=1 Tax=Branchiostoma lanceolatum TaxID=7740 RepID=A0A8J9ZMK4_BRALA|nr:Hypp1970 [Branchiostoma lanceolatum]
MYRKPPGFRRTRSRVEPFPDHGSSIFLSWFLILAVLVIVTIVLLTISLRPLFLEESPMKKELMNAQEKTMKTVCPDTGTAAKGKTGQSWRKGQNKRRGNRGGNAW